MSLVLSFVCMSLVLHQQTIDILVENQALETARAYQQSLDMANLRRDLDAHMAECGGEEIEILAKQLDLLTAASRSSWADAHRLLRTIEPLSGQ